MQNQIRIELESRRFVMQLLIRIKEFVTCDIDPFLELLNHLIKRRVTHRIVELVGVLPEWGPYLRVLFSKSPYRNHGFVKAPFEFEKQHSIIAEFYNQYPSTRAFRYEPQVPRIASLSNVQYTFNHIITTMQLADQNVYVYYFKYAILLEVSLHDISKVTGDTLFNSWCEDVVILPSNLEWVIAYTGTDKWYAGYKKTKKRQ